MTIEQMLQDIYDHEFNIRLSWFWDAGFDAEIGDEAKGWKAKENFSTLREGVTWLFDETVGKIKLPLPTWD